MDKMVPLSPQSVESQHIQLNIYIGTATTALPTNTASTKLSHTEPSMFAPTNSYWNRKSNISEQHSTGATTLNGFSTGSNRKWTSNSVTHNGTATQTCIGTLTKNHIFTVFPYSKGLSESFRNICGKAGVQVHFKGVNTVKELLVAPKDKDSIIQTWSVIYRYRCDQPECTMECIGR